MYHCDKTIEMKKKSDQLRNQMCNSLTHPYHKVVIHLIGKNTFIVYLALSKWRLQKVSNNQLNTKKLPEFDRYLLVYIAQNELWEVWTIVLECMLIKFWLPIAIKSKMKWIWVKTSKDVDQLQTVKICKLACSSWIYFRPTSQPWMWIQQFTS